MYTFKREHPGGPKRGPPTPGCGGAGRGAGIKKNLEFVTFEAFWSLRNLGASAPRIGKLGKSVLEWDLGASSGHSGPPIWGNGWPKYRLGAGFGTL